MRARIAFIALVCALFSVFAVSGSAASGDPIGSGASGTAVGADVTPATAALITFNEFAGTGNPILTSVTTMGFNFASGHEHIMNQPALCLFGGCISNGTPYLAEEDGSLGQVITMTRVGGGKFKLKALDGGPVFNDFAAARAGGFPNADSILVVGTKMNGSQVSTSLTLNGAAAFQHFILPRSFKGLVSVKYYGNNTSNTGGISLDNISVKFR